MLCSRALLQRIPVTEGTEGTRSLMLGCTFTIHNPSRRQVPPLPVLHWLPASQRVVPPTALHLTPPTYPSAPKTQPLPLLLLQGIEDLCSLCPELYTQHTGCPHPDLSLHHLLPGSLL